MEENKLIIILMLLYLKIFNEILSENKPFINKKQLKQLYIIGKKKK